MGCFESKDKNSIQEQKIKPDGTSQQDNASSPQGPQHDREDSGKQDERNSNTMEAGATSNKETDSPLAEEADTKEKEERNSKLVIQMAVKSNGESTAGPVNVGDIDIDIQGTKEKEIEQDQVQSCRETEKPTSNVTSAQTSGKKDQEKDKRNNVKEMDVVAGGNTKLSRTSNESGTTETSTEGNMNSDSYKNKLQLTSHEQNTGQTSEKKQLVKNNSQIEDTPEIKMEHHSTLRSDSKRTNETNEVQTSGKQDQEKHSRETPPADSNANTPVAPKRKEYVKKYEEMREQYEKAAQDCQNKDKELQNLEDIVKMKDNEIKNLQKSNAELDKELNAVCVRADKAIQENGNKSKGNAITKLTYEIAEMQKEIANKNREMEDLKREKHAELERIRTEMHEKDVALARKLDEIQNIEKEKEQLLLRLSEMAGRRLTDNNPNIADLSDFNRPTKLAEKYSELYDNEWTDAFSYLQSFDAYKDCEKDIIAALVSMLTIAYKVSLNTAGTQLNTLRKTLNDFHGNATDQSQQVNDVIKQLKDNRKRIIHPSKELMEEYRNELEKSLPILQSSSFDADALKSYLKKCLELCWLMAIQDPPVHIMNEGCKEGDPFDKNMYKEYTQSGLVILYTVWPAVLLEKDGALLCKGVVQCKKLNSLHLPKVSIPEKVKRTSTSLYTQSKALTMPTAALQSVDKANEGILNSSKSAYIDKSKSVQSAGTTKHTFTEML